MLVFSHYARHVCPCPAEPQTKSRFSQTVPLIQYITSFRSFPHSGQYHRIELPPYALNDAIALRSYDFCSISPAAVWSDLEDDVATAKWTSRESAQERYDHVDKQKALVYLPMLNSRYTSKKMRDVAQ